MAITMIIGILMRKEADGVSWFMERTTERQQDYNVKSSLTTAENASAHF